jgi:hypothetical protein
MMTRKLLKTLAAGTIAATAATALLGISSARADVTRTYAIQGGDLTLGGRLDGSITTITDALANLVDLVWDFRALGTPYGDFFFNPNTSHGVLIPDGAGGQEFQFSTYVPWPCGVALDMGSAEAERLLAGASTVNLLPGSPTLSVVVNSFPPESAAGSASLVETSVAVPAPEAGTGLAGLLGVAGGALLARRARAASRNKDGFLFHTSA